MKPIHGKILMATAVLHSGIIAPLIYWDKWLEFFGKGLLDVSPHSLTAGPPIIAGIFDMTAEAAIWFFIGGVVFFITGQLMHHLEKNMGKLPAFVGWELLAVAIVFAWMLPISGFTFILIPQAAYILVRYRKKAVTQ